MANPRASGTRLVQRLRTRLRLEQMSHAAGFSDVPSYVYDLYICQHRTLLDVAETLNVSRFRLRKILHDIGVETRSSHDSRRRIVITDTLIDEVSRDGVTAVAERLGVAVQSLRARLDELWRAAKKKVERLNFLCDRLYRVRREERDDVIQH